MDSGCDVLSKSERDEEDFSFLIEDGNKKIIIAGLKKYILEELNGLVSTGTFIRTQTGQVPYGTRIFRTSFVDDLKMAERGMQHRIRLVAQNYHDEEARDIETKEPTVQRYSKRLLPILADSRPSIVPYTRDICAK